MKVLISGSNGFIGKHLKQFLIRKNFSVTSLVRNHPKDSEILFKPDNNYLDTSSIKGVNVVINLSGSNIAVRWSKKNKKLIKDSRLNSTKTLVNSILKLKHPPELFISASAVGIYGNRASEILFEESNAGSDFLSKLCIEWESEANRLNQKDVRVVNLRLGMVLENSGGVLKKMIPVFKSGLGTIVGSGDQYISWIDIKDLLSLVSFIIKTPGIKGPVNACSPNPVTNQEFSLELARSLKKPCFLKIPTCAIRLLMGEMGNVILYSQRVEPRKVLTKGFKFNHESLKFS